MILQNNTQFTYFPCPTQEAKTASSWEDLAPYFDITKGKAPEGLWWLDVSSATASDVTAIARSLCIHPLTIEDIVFQEPRQKIETFPGYYLISLRTLASTFDSEDDAEPKEPDQLPPTPSHPTMLYILVFTSGTVTFSPSGCDHASRVRSRISRVHDRSILSSDWICYALFLSDEVIDSFAPYMETTSRQSESIQDSIFTARDADMGPLMQRIYTIRKRINHLTHSLSGKSDVLNGFVKRFHSRTNMMQHSFPEGDLLVYLSDVQDHLVTILAELSHLDEITSRLQSNFLAQTGVNNMRLSVRLNDGLSKVTVLATIFVPLQMITGLFGMNVTVPGQDVASLVWFFGIVGVFAAVVLGACFVAVRMRLL
ncbi:magnesium transporter CorA family protein [Aspergillus mulundensis]|uniref:CorA family metal ion transporter n=1 Tax=Aspergillus mulundensis TaxID=1810919 RepID=A0A3D8QN42_9EURO|nr:CorA family metal ion transporter [Aspergillus mulundensis]RDW63222.1 CorA family metal ion transporter [Aspergillus mulundensis]